MKSRKEVVNYIKVKNRIPRNDNEKVCGTLSYHISKTLVWKHLGAEFSDDEYFNTINSKRKILKVRYISTLNTKWKIFWYSKTSKTTSCMVCI